MFRPGRGFRRAWLTVALRACVAAALLATVVTDTTVAAPDAGPPVYRIGPGDGLEILVWRQPELSTAVTVRPDGRISVPLIEDLPAAGKTPTELADDIEDRLSQYLQDPLVTVTVGSGLGDPRQQIRVVGKGTDPQAVAFRSGMTVLDAVIATGGLSRQAAGNGAVILRRSGGHTQRIPVRLADLVRDGDSTANVALQPGDTIIVPEGFFDGEWHLTLGASASETISDNIDQAPSGEREPGLVSRAGPNFAIRGNTARIVAGFNGNLAGVHQIGGDDEGFSLDPRLSGTSTTEISEDLFFFDLRAAVSRQLLSSRDSTSASGASTSNRDLVATMTASPYLVHRVGDFADAEWRDSFIPVLVDSENTSDAYIHDGRIVFDSGPDFQFFGWTWTNSAGQEVRTDEGDITTANTDFGVSYPLWTGFALIGAIGYEYRDGDEEEENNFDGMTWRTGFAWEPHPDLSLQATYGRRDDDDNFAGSLFYRLGPKTSLTASYAEALQTSQERAVSRLGNVTLDPDTGELIDEDTDQPFDDDDPFTFEDETTRTKTFQVGADHRSGRDVFRLTGLAGTSEGGSEGDEEFYQALATWGRPLSPVLTFTSSVGYEHSIFDDDGRKDDNYNLDLGLAYRLTSDARALVNYSFQARDSTDSGESYYENAVTLGIAVNF